MTISCTLHDNHYRYTSDTSVKKLHAKDCYQNSSCLPENFIIISKSSDLARLHSSSIFHSWVFHISEGIFSFVGGRNVLRVFERILLGRHGSPCASLRTWRVCRRLLCHVLLWTAMILEFDVTALGRSLLPCFPPLVGGYASEDKEDEMDDPNMQRQRRSPVEIPSSSLTPSAGASYKIKAKNTFAAISILPKV